MANQTEQFDAIIIGAGHNGLVAAGYLARAGKKVAVLEKRDRVGGACTLEEPFPGFTMSPCAYVVSLLRPEIIRDLELHENRGLQTRSHSADEKKNIPHFYQAC